MKHYWRLVFGVSCLLFLAACSSTDDDGPAELIEFEPERYFQKQWSNSVGNGQGDIYNRLDPIISGDLIYVASVDGDVEAIQLADGDTLWSMDLDTDLASAVGYGNGIIAVGNKAGELIAIDANAQEELWRIQIPGEFVAPPVINGDLIYIQTVDARVLALSTADGSNVWSYQNTIPVLTLRGTSVPVIYRDTLIVGFANGRVLGFDAAKGSLKWDVRVAIAQGNSEIERIIDVDGKMLIENDTLYVVSYQGRVMAIDPQAGRRLWSREASSHVGVAKGRGNLYVSAADGNIIAFVQNGRDVRWEQTILGKRKLTAPVTVDDYVVVGDFEGYLHAFTQLDGLPAARTQVDSDGIRVDMIPYQDGFITYTNSGKLAYYTLSEKSGFFW